MPPPILSDCLWNYYKTGFRAGERGWGMAEDFEGVERLKRLKDDAKRAAAVIDAAKEESVQKSPSTAVIDITRPPSKSRPAENGMSPSPHSDVALQPVSLSTLVLASTKKRLARASHLQAASEQTPSTQWEIVNQAINEWCKSRGY